MQDVSIDLSTPADGDAAISRRFVGIDALFLVAGVHIFPSLSLSLSLSLFLSFFLSYTNSGCEMAMGSLAAELGAQLLGSGASVLQAHLPQHDNQDPSVLQVKKT